MASNWLKLSDIPESQLTPMLRQYIQAKAEAGDSIARPHPELLRRLIELKRLKDGLASISAPSYIGAWIEQPSRERDRLI